MLLSRRVAALLIAIAAVLPLSGSRRAPNHQPDLVLWAWERPEDLRSAEPNHVEIAYLAETLTVGRSGLGVHHRMQPLRVAPLTQVIATVRLESGSGADLGAATRERVVQELATVAGLPRVSGLQIDFDAVGSQREFYRALLSELRARLGPGQWIGITALASWCMADDWMDGLPVNEAVPMLFSLGAGRADAEAYLESGADFRSPLCRHSVGLRLGDSLTLIPHHRRVYIFSDRAWNADLVARADHIARQLQ